MEDKEMKEFSWQALFFVTGISFLLFSCGLKFLDGVYSIPMLWIGAIALVLGLISWIGSLLPKTHSKKKRNLVS